MKRMDKKQWEGRIIDYLDGKGSEAERAAVERELAQSEEAYALYEQLREVIQTIDKARELEPSGTLKENFNAALHAEIAALKHPRTIFFTPMMYKAAAAIVFVMIGVGIGYWINRNHELELAAVKHEMEEMKSLMLSQLDNQQSATQRLVGVSVAYKMESTDDDIVNALAKAMNEDPNTNVRVAALEALRKFQHFPHVRQRLVASLATQNDPAVQIELIRLMVEMKEKEVLQQLEKITTDEKALPAVKDEAHSGILKLS